MSGRVVIPKQKTKKLFKSAIAIVSPYNFIYLNRIKMMKNTKKKTDSAANRLKYLISTSPKDTKGVRLGVKTRGCNGLSYTLDFTTKIQEFDEHVQDKGIDIYIDPRALMYVVGTKMDYVEGKLQSEFIFENPNATDSCGCGESFSVN